MVNLRSLQMTLGSYCGALQLWSTYKVEKTVIFLSEPIDFADILRNTLNPLSVHPSGTWQWLTPEIFHFSTENHICCSQCWRMLNEYVLQTRMDPHFLRANNVRVVFKGSIHLAAHTEAYSKAIFCQPLWSITPIDPRQGHENIHFPSEMHMFCFMFCEYSWNLNIGWWSRNQPFKLTVHAQRGRRNVRWNVMGGWFRKNPWI